MAFSDLTPLEQEQVRTFIRDYRAAMADTVRGLENQKQLKVAFDTFIGPLWSQIADADLILDGTGLSGADTTMTKANFTPIFLWSTNLLAAVYSAGGDSAVNWPAGSVVLAYGIQLAGPNNV